jgi:hypothetical protein
MFSRSLRQIPLLLVIVSGPLACTNSQHPGEGGLVPVSGRIMYKDQPVRGALVTFVVDSEQRKEGYDANGKTDSEGRFKIATYPFGPGAAPGRYKVTVMHYTRSDDLPRKYVKYWLTPLVVDVGPSGATDLVLTLED